VDECVLLADIGATNARFAFLVHGSLSPITSFEVRNFSTFEDALAAFNNSNVGARASRAILAVAGPIDHERCVLTNCSWVIDAHVLKRSFGSEAKIVNDFEAVALAIPALQLDGLSQIGGGRSQNAAAKVVLGPGTGLGVSALLVNARGPLVLASEGGHVTLAGASEREDCIITLLRKRFGHASAERAISGSGLENIYQAVIALDGKRASPLSAAEITGRALAAECGSCREALQIFCALLGSWLCKNALPEVSKRHDLVALGAL
jgi:glucokinase